MSCSNFPAAHDITDGWKHRGRHHVPPNPYTHPPHPKNERAYKQEPASNPRRKGTVGRTVGQNHSDIRHPISKLLTAGETNFSTCFASNARARERELDLVSTTSTSQVSTELLKPSSAITDQKTPNSAFWNPSQRGQAGENPQTTSDFIR